MRAVFAIASTGFIALGCTSLTVVDKTPKKETVAEILLDEFTCREVAGAEPCDPAEQPKEIRLTSLDCRALPLRSGVREDAHARCVYSGEIIRANGRKDPLGPAESGFSLIDYTPGVYIPTREWSLDKSR